MSPSTPTPAIGGSYFVLPESAEHDLWRARDLLSTLAELALAAAPAGEVRLPAERLSTTLFLAAELLDLPMTFVSVHQEVSQQ